MTSPRQFSWLRSWLRATFRRRRMETDMDAELRFHLQARAEDLIRSGVPIHEALRRARLEFGAVEATKEECRQARGLAALDSISRDVRFSVRMMRRTPGFTAIAVLTMALGIGACATLLSIVYDGFFVHIAREDIWYAVLASEPERHISQYRFSVPEYRDILANAGAFEQLGTMGSCRATLDRGDYPEPVPCAYMSANIIPMLHTQPILGRSFLLEEDRPGGPKVAIIRAELWKARFGGDRNIIGREMILNQQEYKIVGVMPEHYPVWGAQIYLPMQLDMDSQDRTNRSFLITGTLRPGASARQAAASLQRVAALWQHDYGATRPEYNGMQMVVRNIPEWVHAAVQPSIVILIAATGLVLIVATVNLANLLLSRAATRHREMAVRAALGASKGRITRQMLGEGVVLAVIGATLGILLSSWTVPLGASFIPYDVLDSAKGYFQLEPVAIAVSLAVAICMGLFFATAPAMRLSRVDVAVALKDASARTAGERTGKRPRNLLVIAETALTIVLMAGSALLIQSYRSLMQTDLGFRPEHVLSMQIPLPRARYSDPQQIAVFYGHLLPKLASMPGVSGAAATTGAPMQDRLIDLLHQDFTIQGRPAPDAASVPTATISAVSHSYFDVVGMRLLAGRFFIDSDTAEAPQVVVVNEALAHNYFHDANPIGQVIHLLQPSPVVHRGDPTGGPRLTIVGVVADMKQIRLIESPVQPQLFVPLEQRPEQALAATVMVRGNAPPSTLEAAGREAVASMDRTQAITTVTTMDEVVRNSFGPKRITTILLGIFAALALVLVVIGFYAVVSYGVAQRTREIGVRMALGAEPRGILCMVLRESAALVVWGIAAGVLCALALTRFLRGLLFGIGYADPGVLTGVSLLLFAVALAACLAPTWRAMRVDPLVALRYE
jgi:putative ABC transport system permease protein